MWAGLWACTGEQTEAPTCSSLATHGCSSGAGKMDMGWHHRLCARREVKAHGPQLLVVASEGGDQEQERGLDLPLLHLSDRG